MDLWGYRRFRTEEEIGVLHPVLKMGTDVVTAV